MRRMNFNNLKKNNVTQESEKPVEPMKPRTSAYRTVIARHNSVSDKLKNEPIAIIKSDG